MASNDGYLLQHFLAAGIPVLGVEPAANVAEAARARGIRTEVQFLGAETGREIARQHGRADLVAANNVFAHVPDIRGFAAGLRALVKDEGMVTLEFPHLLRLIERRQYDTIYHEHFSYLSLLTSSRALATAGLRVVDVDELGTHGGSLRVYARPEESAGEPTERVKAVLDAEEAAGLHTVAGHEGFAAAVLKIKSDLLGFLLTAAREGRSVAGYGAPGKGNTLLNHCGIRSDLLAYTVDRSPVKQGKFLPGTHIPIYAPERLAETRPDYILVLPWNLREEISRQLGYVRSWGGRLVFPIPELEIVLWGVNHEGRAFLRWPRDADARRRQQRPQADGDDRRPADAVACHALLRPFRPHRFRALPGVRRVVRQGLLPELRRDPVQRLRPGARRPGGEAVQDGHLRLADHLRRHRPELADRRAAAPGPPVRRGRADVPGQLRGRLTNAPLPDMIERFEASDAVASLLAVPPQSSHHVVDIGEDGLITQVTPMRDLRQWENGGYFVLRPEIFDHLNEGEDLVEDAHRAAGPAAAGCWPTRTRGTGRPPTR